MQLSIRMQAVADMVTPGGRIADIGTDHGYVPIYLVEQNKTDHAIAMVCERGHWPGLVRILSDSGAATE